MCVCVADLTEVNQMHARGTSTTIKMTAKKEPNYFEFASFLKVSRLQDNLHFSHTGAESFITYQTSLNSNTLALRGANFFNQTEWWEAQGLASRVNVQTCVLILLLCSLSGEVLQFWSAQKHESV